MLEASAAQPSRVVRYTASMDSRVTDEWDAGLVVLGLWVGSLSAAESVAGLVSHGITHVVTTAARLRPDLPPGLSHTEVALDDHPCADLLGKLRPALEAIDAGLAAPSGQILVHCASGVSRSAATCAAWLMTRQGRSFDEALRDIREGRPVANPNFGFKQALQVLEAEDGDLEAAAAKCNQESRQGAADQVRAQREAANGFHTRVDELEERVAHHKSSTGDAGALPNELRAALEALKKDIEAAAPEADQGDDRVAQSIRRAAVQKLERLLEGPKA